jgi:cell division protein FtsL
MRKVTYMLIFVCLASVIAVIWVRHENREVFVELQALYHHRDDLNIEWRNLLTERTSLTRHDQLENWAQTNVKMQAPEEQLVLLLHKHSQQVAAPEVSQ